MELIATLTDVLMGLLGKLASAGALLFLCFVALDVWRFFAAGAQFFHQAQRHYARENARASATA